MTWIYNRNNGLLPNGDMASVRWNIASSSNGTITVVLRGGSVRLYGC